MNTMTSCRVNPPDRMASASDLRVGTHHGGYIVSSINTTQRENYESTVIYMKKKEVGEKLEEEGEEVTMASRADEEEEDLTCMKRSPRVVDEVAEEGEKKEEELEEEGKAFQSKKITAEVAMASGTEEAEEEEEETKEEDQPPTERSPSPHVADELEEAKEIKHEEDRKQEGKAYQYEKTTTDRCQQQQEQQQRPFRMPDGSIKPVKPKKIPPAEEFFIPKPPPPPRHASVTKKARTMKHINVETEKKHELELELELVSEAQTKVTDHSDPKKLKTEMPKPKLPPATNALSSATGTAIPDTNRKLFSPENGNDGLKQTKMDTYMQKRKGSVIRGNYGNGQKKRSAAMPMVYEPASGTKDDPIEIFSSDSSDGTGA